MLLYLAFNVYFTNSNAQQDEEGEGESDDNVDEEEEELKNIVVSTASSTQPIQQARMTWYNK